MAVWSVANPVNFTTDGDMVSQAIYKHIEEIRKIYGHLNQLRRLSASATSPADPEGYDVWLNPASMELLLYLAGEKKWVNRVRVQYSAASGDCERLGGYAASDFARRRSLEDHEADAEAHMTDEDREKLYAPPAAGASEERPEDAPAGTAFFDATLGLPIWWTGAKWVRAGGDDADEPPDVQA